MVTVYKKGDAGAPALVYNTAQATIANFAAFKTILKACLVNGYGSKAAAGWELIAEGTQYLVLRNATHTGYVCFSWLGSYTMTVYLAETYSGVTNNVMTGDGLKSGVAAGITLPQKLVLISLAFSDAISSWYVVADGKSFMFGGSGFTSDVSIGSSSGYALKPLYVGEDSRGNFISIGGDGATTDSTSSVNYFRARAMTVLKDPSTGLLVDTGAISTVIPAMGEITPGSWKSTQGAPLEEVTLSRMAWGKSGAAGIAGYLRGLALPAELTVVSLDTAVTSLGGSGTVISKVHLPIGLGDAFTYLPGAASAAMPTFLVTDNPGFW